MLAARIISLLLSRTMAPILVTCKSAKMAPSILSLKVPSFGGYQHPIEKIFCFGAFKQLEKLDRRAIDYSMAAFGLES